MGAKPIRATAAASFADAPAGAVSSCAPFAPCASSEPSSFASSPLPVLEGKGAQVASAASAVRGAGMTPAASVVRQANAAQRQLATFRSLYSSRDGALCVYEDEEGHLIAIDASKFA